MNFSIIYAAFMLSLTDYIIFRANGYKMAENALRHMLLNLLLLECNSFLSHFTLHYEQDYVLFGPRQSSLIFCFSVFNSVLTREGGRGWARSRVIRPQESLALYKLFNTLC
jgi:hypothetical protein